jgi:polysaccharide biosynthesis protein PslA
MMAILAVGVATATVYHLATYGSAGDTLMQLRVSSLVAIGYGLSFLLRGDYTAEALVEGHRSNSRLLANWTLVFLGLAAIGFLTKTAAIFSRGWMVLFFCAGFMTVMVMNAVLRRLMAGLLSRGLLRRRKLMIIGAGFDDVQRLRREISDGAASVLVISDVVLEGTPEDSSSFEANLERAVELARSLSIEDVMISSAVGSGAAAERCIQAFGLLPVAIHLGAGGLISRFKDAEVARLGRATALSLMRQPLGPWEAAAKRALDLSLAMVAVVLLAPVFLLIALAIRIDSTGPVFFRQRRRGFNLEEFPIWKFRTMTTLEDGDTVIQATRADPRVTRVGQFLRRYSLDELPQLFNVIQGDMSLVGPRPHAVAHDRIFEKKLGQYPRRLNVKPGITGWAQVNGFRGATNTDEAMQYRLEHDLYYIDNWSLSFDIYILALTVISPKASQNAY